MATQTRTWQNKILSAAADQYAGLFWYIEITATGRRVFPAAHPGVHIPVVAVAPDPEQTRHYAHLLAELDRLRAGIAAVTTGFAPEPTNDVERHHQNV